MISQMITDTSGGKVEGTNLKEHFLFLRYFPDASFIVLSSSGIYCMLDMQRHDMSEMHQLQ